MFQTKYFDGVDEAAKNRPDLSSLPPFDLERLATKGFAARLISRLLNNPRPLLAILRRFAPTLRIGGFAIITRNDDVREALERSADFQTPYGPEMTELAGGSTFILGMQDGPDYRRLKPLVLAAFPPGEIEAKVRPLAARLSQDIMARAEPGFDAIGGLMKRVPAMICRDFYGLLVDDEILFADWSLALSALFFSDPTGSRVTRELALIAGRNMLSLIDRSLEAAQGNPARADTPVGRLAAMIAGGQLTQAEARSILMGMIAGFVPTNILAGGNALDVILSRKDARAAVDAAIAARDTDALDRAIREAMRFHPIWVGPWRYVPADTVIATGTRRQKTIPAGTTVMPATWSAMFDPEAVDEPERFDPDRPARDYMVFGHGIHLCIGAELARVQIGESLRALFERPGVARAKGKAGRLDRLGAYPRHLGVTFKLTPLSSIAEHAMVTVSCPVAANIAPPEMRTAIAGLGNPACPAMQQALDAAGTIHFSSLVFVEPEPGGKGRGHLVLEISGDGTSDAMIAAYAKATEPLLRPIFHMATGLADSAPFERILTRNLVTISPTFGSNSGLVFSGTPGHSVARIQAEARLADAVSAIVEDSRGVRSMTAGERLDAARTAIRARPEFAWAFEPAESLLERPAGSIGSAIKATLLAPRMFALVAVWMVFSIWLTQYLVLGNRPGNVLVLGTALVLALLGNALALAAAIGGAAWLLRRLETSDEPEDRAIPLDRLEFIQQGENHRMQNHLTAISTLKGGWLRLLALRLSFYLISISARKVFRPGYLADLNTIHFARWVTLPGTKKLLFLSNYDGSWESYLEDFIAKASAGLTGIWSNALGYPRTRFLFLDGARDGERFKRWARRQQAPTLFWYSAYPDLTTGRIRIHSAIRRGLARASQAEARDWLSLFGSMPPRAVSAKRGGFSVVHPSPIPLEQLETGEIQSVFFNAMGALEDGRMLAFSIPDGITWPALAEWLTWARGATSFGDRVPSQQAMLLALGPRALVALGLPDQEGSRAIESFPAAFRQGMDSPARSRILDGRSLDRPETWAWGGPANPVDGVIVLYANSMERLAEIEREATERLDRAGMVLAATLPLGVKRNGDGKAIEQFGYRDGLSQPLVRGTRRAQERGSRMHLVQPGEFLFGYYDDHGFRPATPQVPAGSDPDGILRDCVTQSAPDGQHDFGRNGSFLVVRQFEQHVDAFDAFCEGAAQAVSAGRDNPVTADWIGAKMVGRWKDGSPLVRNPEGQAGHKLDNEYSFAAEDAQGLRCPFGSHVRRVNPRDSLGTDSKVELRINNRHRILRVGRTYETTEPRPEKGLLFMCLNADIERQYEFIQQTWVASPSFHGLSGETDPLIAAGEDEARFTIPEWENATVLEGLKRFVTTRGGGYFFLPSRSALRYLEARLTR